MYNTVSFLGYFTWKKNSHSDFALYHIILLMNLSKWLKHFLKLLKFQNFNFDFNVQKSKFIVTIWHYHSMSGNNRIHSHHYC